MVELSVPVTTLVIVLTTVVPLETVATPVVVETTGVVVFPAALVVYDVTREVVVEVAIDDVEAVVTESTDVVSVVDGAVLRVEGRVATPRLIPMPKAIAIAENATMRLLYSDMWLPAVTIFWILLLCFSTDVIEQCGLF